MRLFVRVIGKVLRLVGISSPEDSPHKTRQCFRSAILAKANPPPENSERFGEKLIEMTQLWERIGPELGNENGTLWRWLFAQECFSSAPFFLA